MSVPSFSKPISTSITPAMMVAAARPSMPSVATMPATMVAKAAVGPEICTRLPPKNAIRKPATGDVCAGAVTERASGDASGMTKKCCNCREITYNCNMTKRNHISAILELAESEGVFTTAQAGRLGIPRDALHDACASGLLERLAHGAYRLMGSGSTEVDELVALWKLTSPKLFAHERLTKWDSVCIGGSSAAYLNGMGDLHLSPYRIYSGKRINSRSPFARFSVRHVSRRDVSFERGIPITRPERTVFDLMLDREDPSLVADALRDAASSSGGFNFAKLEEMLVGKFGKVKGAALLEALLANSGMPEGAIR